MMYWYRCYISSPPKKKENIQLYGATRCLLNKGAQVWPTGPTGPAFLSTGLVGLESPEKEPNFPEIFLTKIVKNDTNIIMGYYVYIYIYYWTRNHALKLKTLKSKFEKTGTNNKQLTKKSWPNEVCCDFEKWMDEVDTCHTGRWVG